MFGGIGYQEVLVVGVVAVLLFGKRLPDVARTWGSSYRDFRRSLNDIKGSFAVDQYESTKTKRPTLDYDDRVTESAPRFAPPAATESSTQSPSEAPPPDESRVT